MIEGVSGTGKTSVCDELLRRGYHAIHGDRALAYQGDPETGEPLEGAAHEHHVWNEAKVRALASDHSEPMTYFCGGSRNFNRFIELFDKVFVLTVDAKSLKQRLETRADDEFGGKPEEQAKILHLHATEEDIPQDAIRIDATANLSHVVDEILSKST